MFNQLFICFYQVILPVPNNWYSTFNCVKSLRIRSYSVRMRENTDQKNSESGHFSGSNHYIPRCKIKSPRNHEVQRMENFCATFVSTFDYGCFIIPQTIYIYIYKRRFELLLRKWSLAMSKMSRQPKFFPIFFEVPF